MEQQQQQPGSYSNFVPPADSAHSAPRSVETLVVVLAAITIAAVLAGICARICGGRHSAAGDATDRDIEGWVEKRCRNCLDSGVSSPTPPPPPPPPEGLQGSKPAEAKK